MRYRLTLQVSHTPMQRQDSLILNQALVGFFHRLQLSTTDSAFSPIVTLKDGSVLVWLEVCCYCPRDVLNESLHIAHPATMPW